jgi:hypothetical protein
VRIDSPSNYYENPVLDVADKRLFTNIADVQTRLGVPTEMRGATTVPHAYLPLDVKMETGTGKTYVYTKTIFELHRRYGFNKFIVAVPSLAIKAGTGQFMTDGAARKHFADVCGLKDGNESVAEKLLAKTAESIDFIMSCGIEYEFRTTLVKGLHDISQSGAMAKQISGAKAYFLQSYTDSDLIINKLNGNEKQFESFSETELNEILSAVKKYVPSACLRGID